MYLNVTSVIDTQHWVTRTQEVMTKSELIHSLALDIQCAKRGFQLTGEEALLEPYIAAVGQYEREMSRLKELVSGDSRLVRSTRGNRGPDYPIPEQCGAARHRTET